MASMAFQATTDVQKPLAAASKIAAKGNRIVLDDAASDSYLENKTSGVRIPLTIENGVYMMEMAVVPSPGEGPVNGDPSGSYDADVIRPLYDVDVNPEEWLRHPGSKNMGRVTPGSCWIHSGRRRKKSTSIASPIFLTGTGANTAFK